MMKNRLFWILLPLIAVLAGFLLANRVELTLSEEISVYLAVGLVLTIDLLVEGVRRYVKGEFILKALIFNYTANLLFSYFFLRIGNLVRIDLYIPLFIVFGMKLFSNLAYISQKFFSKPQV
jgi:small basic protein